MQTFFLIFGIFVAIASVLASTVFCVITYLRSQREKDVYNLMLKSHEEFTERVAQAQQFTVDMWNEIFKEFTNRVAAGIPIGVYLMDPSAELKTKVSLDAGNFSVLLAHAAQSFGQDAPISPTVHQSSHTPHPQHTAPVQQPLAVSDNFPQQAYQGMQQEIQQAMQQGILVPANTPSHGYQPSNRPVISSENPQLLQHAAQQQQPTQDPQQEG